MSLKDIINPAGGIYYHLNAAKYRSKLWKPFIQSIKTFLDQWAPKSPNLVILGGSGGYCLNSDFLNQFKEVVLIDPDPLAGWVFQFRFKKKIKTIKRNYLKNNKLQIQELVDDFPNHAFLFSNFLGQLPYLIKIDENKVIDLKESLQQSLSTFEWASFHDLLSFHFSKSHPKLCWPLILQSKNNSEAIHYLRQQNQLRPTDIQVVDHCTEGLFPENSNKQKLYWKRTPYSYHIIEVVFR
ncbi:MAG: hypothetical protein H6625_04490 [Bdellovibrionaceae bacterium]|nr:hypothetical protein [Pseudobdellovibrionaceae bacterium]